MSTSSKSRVIVLTALAGDLTVTEVAQRYGVSRRWVHILLARYREGGLHALEPKSRAPLNNSGRISDLVRGEIARLRTELGRQGLDNGADTIAWHLAEAGLAVPARSSIWRVLHERNLVTPQPKKKPKAFSQRFTAHQPNECWQSDFTHWCLADGTDVEILNWLDDHSRFLIRSLNWTYATFAPVHATYVQ